MENNDPKRREDVKDPVGRLGWPKDKGRDGERTPMQWNAGPRAGFSSGELTWLPVAPDYKKRNAATESSDPQSLLNFYKAIIRLRKEEPALRDGDYTPLLENDNMVLAWQSKTKDGKAAIVALNFTASPQTIHLNLPAKATILLSSFSKPGTRSDPNNLTLPAYGCLIAKLE